MKKIIIATIAGLFTVIGIVVLNTNDTSIEHVNEEIKANPPAAGSGLIYKVTEGGVTTYTDVRPRTLSNSTTSVSQARINATNQVTMRTPTSTTASTSLRSSAGANITVATASQSATNTSAQQSAPTPTPTTTTASSSSASASSGGSAGGDIGIATASPTTTDTTVQESTTTPTTTTDSASLRSPAGTDIIIATASPVIVDAIVQESLPMAPISSLRTDNVITTQSGAIVEVIQAATLNPSPEDVYTEPSLKHSQWESQFAMFPQDQNGWSIITPSVDSRMIYVSSTEGDDSKAKAYFSKDIPDPRNPPASIVAFKTIEAALKLQRDGYSDWVLLKKGDEWQLDKTIFLPSGRSDVAPLVITSYGNSTQRPLIKTGVRDGIKLTQNRSFITVIGIEFYANQRDPDSASFVGWSMVGNPVGFASISGDSREVESLTLEDNVFSFFAVNIQFNGESKHKNIVVRRSQGLNSYSTMSHSTGLFVAQASLLLEENLFDHNGWYQQNYENLNSQSKGQATFFNHNAYLANMSDTVIIGNVFSRASSIGLKLISNNNQTKINSVTAKNIVIDNNLIIEGEVGISAGGNTDYNNGYRWQNMTIINNVLLNIGKSQPTRRYVADHINANDWDGGVISGNYLLCNSNPYVTDVSGISVVGLTRNVSVLDNMVFGLKGSKDKMIYTRTNEEQTDLLFKDNVVSKDATCDSELFASDSYVNQFIDNAKKQSATNWKDLYTASNFNDFVKASFTQ